MLRWRLFLGVLIIAAFVGLCWLDELAPVDGLVLFPVLVVFILLATREVLNLAAVGGMHPLRHVVYAGNLLIAGAAWVAPIWWDFFGPGAGQAAEASRPFVTMVTEWTMLAVAGAVLVAFIAEMRRFEKPGGVTVNLAAAVFAMVYLGFFLSFLVQLRMIWGLGALASLLIVVKLGDVGAYTVGRLIGRYKMAPGLSPGKTIEGAAGAFLFSIAASWATFRWLVPALGPEDRLPGPWWGWVLFGVAVCAAGMAGDLAESLLKRDAQRKDSSQLMPGFGGVLDVLDSPLLAGPVAYAFWALEWVR
jgi:phosphatidate cytidylyltransferase